jgi:hypothetical protein
MFLVSTPFDATRLEKKTDSKKQPGVLNRCNGLKLFGFFCGGVSVVVAV